MQILKSLLLVGLFLSSCICLQAQMFFQGESLYGNEWVDLSKSYSKFTVVEDGYYRISYEELVNAGFPSTIKGREIQLFSLGKQVPIYTTKLGDFQAGDFIEFIANKNRGELDQPLFEDWESEQLNPDYSMFSDERPYYITWETNSSGNARIEDLENDLSGTIPNVEPYFYEEAKNVYSSFHLRPVLNQENVRYSHFFATEGYGSKLENITEIDFSTPGLVSNATNSRVKIRLASNGGSHITNITFNNKLLINDIFQSFAVKDYEFEILSSDVNDDNLLSIEGLQSQFDSYSIAHATLEYPRAFDAENANEFIFNFEAHSFSKYFEVSNFNTAQGTPVVIDVENNVRLTPVFANGKIQFLLPGTDTDRKLWVANQPKSVPAFEAIDFVDFEQLDPEYVIITSRALDTPDDDGENWIRNYQAFRQSQEGESYRTEVVHVEDIIEQFGYGITNHSIGINNWSMFIRDKWTDWEFAFLMGKAYEYGELRKDNGSLVNQIPTHGEPGSDHLLFAENAVSYPVVSIGRLAAKNKAHLKLYYDKMQSYIAVDQWQQTIESKAWMKNVIHLSGGDASIQFIIKNWLEEFEEIIEESSFGGNVSTFSKTTSDPIQNSLSQSIIDKINEGATLITFFGHSAVGTFDFSIEDPSKFDNQGKLPIILSLGCHSGNIHTSTVGISEDFVLHPETGAICFYASSGTAYINPQYIQGRDFYDLFGNDLYGVETGKILLQDLQNNFVPNDFQVVSLYEQLTLHGDPAIKLNPHEGPDYIPDIQTFGTFPEVVSTNLDSFDLSFDIANIGRAVEDSLEYLIIHHYGTESDTFYFNTPSPKFRQSLSHTLPTNGLRASGKNTIEVVVDPNNKIAEIPDPAAESNNSLNEAYQIEGYCFYVVSDNPIPFYPPEFAITNKDGLTLQASTGNAFVESKQYEIEIDTTELFNSAIKVSETITANGGLIKWTPSIQYNDRVVYYWRVRSVDSEGENVIWNQSSFVHIDEFDDGWNQSHLYQYLKDDYSTLYIDSTTRNFDYVPSIYEFKFINRVIQGQDFSQFSFNGSLADGWYLTNPAFNAGLAVVVIDPTSVSPISSPGNGVLGVDTPSNWSTQERNSWRFKTDLPEERAELMNFLTNEIPDGHYVFIVSLQRPAVDYKPELWEEEIFELFESEGASAVRSLVGNARPYLFAYQKGEGAINEYIAQSTDDVIDQIISISGLWFEGTVESTKIGPASRWNKFLWDIKDYEPNEDFFNISLLGVKANGQEDTLVASVQNKEYDLSAIDADEYPCLRLNYYSTDTISKSSPDLDYWRVVYKPLPEAVLNTEDNFVFLADTLLRGEDLILNFQIDNVSTTNMDSMLVHYTIIDRQNNEELSLDRRSPIQAENSILADFTKSTNNLNGLYDLRVEINPDKDQPEQYDFNNLGLLRFFVSNDQLNPIIDVTFDGVKILDGDIVSPSPLIKVTLTDDNPYLNLDNPEDFELVLEYPGGSLEQIDLTSESVNFIPADDESEENRACLEFSPSLTEGEYTIYVQGKDASGNFSGDQAYSVSFKVFEEDMISNVLNYPNPFSTSTQFIYTLTGSNVPENYHIKVMTMSGKVVREITQDQLGPIRVGINRSDYKWDGKDEYGERLANGVYIYKFYTDQDNELKSFTLGEVDSYFKQGFGKLVIMR